MARREEEEEEEGEEEVTTRRIFMQRPSTLPLCLQHSTCTTKDFRPHIIDPTISEDCISMSPMSSLAQYMYTTKNAYLLAISWELKELCWCQNNQIFNAVIDCQKNTEKMRTNLGKAVISKQPFLGCQFKILQKIFSFLLRWVQFFVALGRVKKRGRHHFQTSSGTYGQKQP